jgi:hypothetical protein
LANLGSESETCVGSRVRLVGVFISFEKNFYRLPFTPSLSGSPYRSFTGSFQVEVLFRRIFLCEFVRLDQRSVWVKFWVVLVLFARCTWLEFVAGYRRLDRLW